jgi:TruD family tRNA pseudouridine synthase
MKLKYRGTDFKVRELLLPDLLVESGGHAVYRVTKRKLTSPEAASVLAREAGVQPSEVAMAGLKDRQGVTIQYMSVPGGRAVDFESPELRIEPVGRMDRELSSADSRGNAFEITARALDGPELNALRRNLSIVRDIGVVNYFDDQRFGNLRHGQGWILHLLFQGEVEAALRTLLLSVSEHEPPHAQRFKEGLEQNWGDWGECARLASRYGQHRSLFEHLEQHPDDFVGAFAFVGQRLRLIHLFAYQSHLWNRAAADYLRKRLSFEERVVLDSIEGPLVMPANERPGDLSAEATLRLPGEGLEDVTVKEHWELYRDVLATERMVPADLAVKNVPGFHLKGEDRPLFVRPEHLRVRPAEPDPEHDGLRQVRLRFELPRGSYATLVVKRLFAGRTGEYPQQQPERGRREEQRRQRRSGFAPVGGGAQRGGPRDDRDDRGPRYDEGHAGASGTSEAARGEDSGSHRPGSRFKRRDPDHDRGPGRVASDYRPYDDRKERSDREGSGDRRDDRRDRPQREGHRSGGRSFSGEGRHYGGGRGGDRNQGGFGGRGGDRERGGYGGRGGDRDRGGFGGRGDDRNQGGFGGRGGDRERGGYGGRGGDRDRGGFGGRGGDRNQGGFGGRGGDRERGGFGGRGGDRNQGGFGGRGGDRERGGYGGRGGDRNQGGFGGRGGDRERGGYGGRGGDRNQGGFGGRGGDRERGGYGGRGGDRNQGGFGARGGDRERGGYGGQGGDRNQGGFGGRGGDRERGGYGGRGGDRNQGGFGGRGGDRERGGFGGRGGDRNQGGFGGRGGDRERGSYGDRGGDRNRGGFGGGGGDRERGGSGGRGGGDRDRGGFGGRGSSGGGPRTSGGDRRGAGQRGGWRPGGGARDGYGGGAGRRAHGRDGGERGERSSGDRD